MTWTIKPISELGEFKEHWQRLNSAAADSLLLDFEFVHDIAAEFTTGEESIAIYRDAGAPRAIAILTRSNRFTWQTLQAPNAPIGFWLCEPSSDIETLLRQLAPALSPQCGVVSMTQQDPAILARPRHSAHLSTLDYIETPRLDFPESFAAYLQGRSKNFRHNITRQKNRLKRDNISARLEFFTDAADMAKAVEDYSRLECASWKGAVNSAVRMDEPQGRFYAKLMTNFAARGEGLVYRYFFGDRLVASDLCLRRQGTLIILKTACDETIQGISTAHLMRLDAFAELLDKQGIRAIEFYGPLKEWHTRLTDASRQMYHVNYYRWQIVKFLHELRMARHKGESTANGDDAEPRPQPADAAAVA
jgi:CelD/BcsL family acetyltransferase involved in cellulose biosynthesis